MVIEHVKWVTCHHSMVWPQVADGGGGIQIRKVAANMMNKQSQTPDRKWSSNLGDRAVC
jgi:hypothetical protein